MSDPADPADPIIPEAPPQTSTRSGRSVRFPGRYRDYLPATRTPLAHIPSKENRIPPQTIESSNNDFDALDVSVTLPTPDVNENMGSPLASGGSVVNGLALEATGPDCFGVYRVYSRKPLPALRDPLQNDNQNMPSDASGSELTPETVSMIQGPLRSEIETMPYFHPFSSPSAAALMLAHHSGAPTQSLGQTTQLAHILGSLGSDLNHIDLLNFDAARENRRIDDYIASTSDNIFQREDGWQESTVQIRLPFDTRVDKLKVPETKAAEFNVPGLYHRDIIDVISSVYRSDLVRSFELIPYKEFWKPFEDAAPERLYGEIYTSNAMIDADDTLCNCYMGNDSGSDDIEVVTVPLLLYSDSTHLASFGNASCWPVYMFLGSESKYVRDKPSSQGCHHIAYMPKVRHKRGLYLNSIY